MQMADILAQMGGLQSMAQELGGSESQAGSGAALTDGRPAGGLLGGRASGFGSAPGLASMLDLNGDGNPLDDILRMAGKAMG